MTRVRPLESIAVGVLYPVAWLLVTAAGAVAFYQRLRERLGGTA